MDSIAFSIGGLDVYWYGVVTSFAILAGLLVTRVHLYLRRESFSGVLDILIISIPVGIIFSRVVYVLLHWVFYWNNLSEILAISHGGLSIYGAFIGLMLAVFIYSSVNRLYFWRWLDVFVPAILLGLAIDQLGHFALQTTIGLPVTGSLVNDHRIMEYVEYAFRPSGFEGYEYYRPVALYQCIWQFFVFFISLGLLYLQTNYRLIRDGNLFLIGMILAAIGRFYFGFLYFSSNPGGSLHFGQWISLMGIVICMGLFLLRKYRSCGFRTRRIFNN